jgi:hypothetical protein
MENRIPLPTDNIYKFYALFGLFLFVFGWALAIHSNNTRNEFFFKSFVELEEIKAIPSPPTAIQVKQQMLEKKIELAIADKPFYLWGTAIIIVLGLFGMLYGFFFWHKHVQPLQDEFFALQKRKLELEVQVAEINAKGQSSQKEGRPG